MMVNSGRRSPPALGNEVLGGMLSIVGGLLIAMVTVGPWRPEPPPVFPVHIMDLQQPISQAERNAAQEPAR